MPKVREFAPSADDEFGVEEKGLWGLCIRQSARLCCLEPDKYVKS